MQISIWEKESFFAPRDIIIIGAGLMGLWCAYELKKKNSSLKILILEKGIIPSGASTRNAGFSCFGSVTELLHDAKKIGEEKMWQIVEMRYKGMKKISKIFSDDEIDSDNCGGYECVTKTLHDLNDLKEKIIWLNKGLKQITSLDETFVFANDKLKKFGFKNFDGLIENNLEGGLHSGKLVQALTRKVQSLGVDILTGITAINWEENKNEILIRTDKNVCLIASQLLVCTNAFSNQLSKNIEITPARGQILVTSPIENLKLNGTFHFDEGYYYFRNLKNRVLLGGARNKCFDEEKTTDFNTSEIIQQELENFLLNHILSNQKFNIEYRWSGIMGFTENKEPMIKKINSKITAVVSCNGMGVALSPIIAEKIADELANQTKFISTTVSSLS